MTSTNQATTNTQTNERGGTVDNRADLEPGPDMIDYLKEYARQKPEVAALWCLGIGFILGWKLKPW